MATEKQRTINEIENAWRRLQDVQAQVQPERMEQGGTVGSWSVRDVIGDVTTWEEEAVKAMERYLPKRDPELLAWPDVDAFNERTVESKCSALVADLLTDFDRTHERTVRFVAGLAAEVLGVEEVEKRIRIDTFAHYAEHTDNIRRWLTET